MLILRFLNNLFGAILLTIGFIPLIALTTIARLFNFIDLLYKGKLGPAFFSIIFSPFTSLFMAVVGTLSLLIWGWNIGLKNFIVTFPTRISHFFKKKLFFGIQPEESIAEISVTRGHPLGLNKIVTSGFFGKLTLKLFSLCFPMEAYIAYEAKTVSPHHDVSLYFTEKNLSILKNKYNSAEIEQSAQIVVEINSYLASKLKISFEKVEELNRLPLSDDTRAGKLQSAQDEFQAIQAAQRCIKYFQVNRSTDNELSSQFRCTPATVLNYIWLAINTECQNEQNKLALKEKLIWTLFQIQRGINIVNGGIGSDMPECPTGAIGLLVRVICDEQEKMPNAEYEAADPSPANLTLALKTALDRPFTSSYGMINKTAREEFDKDSQSYKDEQKKGIKRLWRKDFKLLLESGVLQEEVIDDIINTGVDAWEPPFEQDNTTSFSV